MKLNYYCYGNWNLDEVKSLNELGIKIELGPASFKVFDDHAQFDEIINITSKAKEGRSKKNFAIYDVNEINKATHYLLEWSPKDLKGPKEQILDCLCESYGKLCCNCNLPHSIKLLEEPIHFDKEPKMKNSELVYCSELLYNVWFTTKDNYENIFKKWKFKPRPIIFGKNRSLSLNSICLIPPYSSSNLLIDNTVYDESMNPMNKNSAYGQFAACEFCNQKLYSKSTLIDYFPKFEIDNDFDYIHTKEWFGYNHRTIVSRAFLDFMHKVKKVKYEAWYTVPVINPINTN
ncbi:MAG: hypothetical protein IT267_00510 [Saprospiraceae bacterium]|nr:hypothetical protein [Saprospiraceae bacterium]